MISLADAVPYITDSIFVGFVLSLITGALIWGALVVWGFFKSISQA